MFKKRKKADAQPEQTIHIDLDAIQRISSGLDGCRKQIGAERYNVDLDCVKRLVRSNREDARRFVEYQCLLAEKEPVQLQVAALIALAYAAEHDDRTLAEGVWETATALGAEDQLARMTAG